MKTADYLEALLVLSISSLVVAQTPVFFADPDLEVAVEAQLGMSDPLPQDMLDLTTLYAQQSRISDLTGIEHAVNMTELHLWENQIAELSPLSQLTHLTILYLWSNQIEDVSPLSGLTDLTVLALPDNQIQDVSALSGLTNLTQLYLYVNQITDIAPLSGMINLEDLYLYNNQIVDISPLSGLVKLTTLELGANQINDITALSGLANLSSLFLWENQILDVSATAELTRLQELYLHANQIPDIAPLSGLINLTRLHLWENQISDVSPLSGMTHLVELDLHDNEIQDVSPLSGLTHLQTLYLYSNQIGDITALSDLTSLTSLDLADNQLTDIEALTALTDMTILELGNNQIKEISSLSELVNLEELYLYINQIMDIAALTGLSRLTHLDLGDNLIIEVAPLSELENLIDLDLGGNRISDISLLAGLTDWELLSLQRNPLGTDAYCTDLYIIASHTGYADYDPNPHPPGHVTASQGLHANEVKISWDVVCNGPSYSSYYQVYRAVSLGDARIAISDWHAETEFIDTAAEAGVSYTYWVRAATNDQGSVGLTDYGIPASGQSGYVDLYDAGELQRGFTPQVLNAGQDVELYTRIENGGTNSSGAFVLDVYLSADTHIDTSDHSLGQAEIAAIAPGIPFDFKGSATVLESIAPGDYYVGWIIDPGNDVMESNEHNNRAYVDGYQLTVSVSDTTPPLPTPLSWATVPHATGQTSIAMTATTAADASGVEYYFDCQTPGGHDSGWQTSSTYEDMGLSPNTAYQYRVLARDSFGNQTDSSNSVLARTHAPAQGVAKDEDTGLWYESIQQAIDAAGPGHTIRVHPGVYTGPVNFNGKVITLCGTDPRDWTVVESTVLNGNGAAGFVTLNSGGVLEGLTITGCQDTDSRKGAIRCTADTPTIRRCIIRDNHGRSSAAISSSGFGSAIVEGCKFLNNSALDYGGALGGAFVVTNCEFYGNRAGMGGGAINGCTSVSGSTFVNNTADMQGGALRSKLSGLAITACSFSGNSAREGGAVYARNPLITNCIIQDNTATHTGGGLYTTQSSIIVGCAILSNTAQAGHGGGIFHGLNRLSLVNCTIRNCSAPFGSGGGIYSDHGLGIKNTILWGNRAATHDQVGGTGDYFYERVHLHSCAIENGSMPYHVIDGGGQVIGLNMGGNFVFADPLFMDTWHLMQNSPCLDQGQIDPALPATDRDGNTRLIGTAVDIGADEIAPDTAVSGSDVLPPTPNPLTWASVPQAAGLTSITMTASTALDPSGAEYLFQCTAGPGHDSAWQRSPAYTDIGLQANADYRYRVRARDMSANQNLGNWSVNASASTPSQVGLHGIDIYIRSTVDDAEELPGGRMVFASPELEFVNKGMDQLVGLRFKNLNIPSNVRIANAYIEFRVGGAESELCSLTIQAQDADDADDFAAFAGLSSLATTSAAVAWSPSAWTSIGAKKQTPDLTSIVQEIVDRSGWRQGNDLVFIMKGSGNRVARSYDSGSYLNGPLLHVDFE